jgi:hypothetical protein
VKFRQELHIKKSLGETIREKATEEKEKTTEGRRKAVNCTRPTKMFPPRLPPIVQSVKKNKIRQKKAGYSVTNVQNGGMKLAQLMNQASLHVTTVKFKKSANLHVLTNAYSNPTFCALFAG